MRDTDLILDKRLDGMEKMLVGLLRQRSGQGKSRDDPGATITRLLVCHFLGHIHSQPVARAAEQLYDRDHSLVSAIADLGGWLRKSVTNPAMTTVAGWAAELIGTSGAGFVASVAPQSSYAALSRRGVRLSFDATGSVRIPMRNATPTVSAVFVGEGSPLPVKRIGTSATTAQPHKAGVISIFTKELAKRSLPSIEAVIRTSIAEDTAEDIDVKLLSADAATTTAPAGLLNGVTPLTASTGTGAEALAADLSALAAAIPFAVDPVYLMNPADAVRAAIIAPGFAAVPIIAAPMLAPKTVIAMDAADFYSGEGDQPVIDVNEQATIINRDDPVAITDAAGVRGAPTTSLFQQALVGIRWLSEMSWGTRRPGRVAAIVGVAW